MDFTVTDFIWIPVLSLLAYTVNACWYDIKYREMPEGFWIPLVIAAGVPTVLLYVSGTYPWYLLALSLGVSGIYFLLERFDKIQGADFMYLLFITLFFVQNPINGHILIPVSYGIFLIASIVGIAMVYQVLKKFGKINIKNFPMMLPISLALWMTVVFG